MNPETRWLTTEAAAVYADFPTPAAFWIWAKRHRVPKARAGRRCRWLREDIDKALSPPDWAAMGYFRKRA
jgi:hypothetical protein